MPDSLVNEVDDRSIDGRKDWAISSSNGIDKPRIRPGCNGHLSRRNGRFRGQTGFHRAVRWYWPGLLS
jgi:hypothetical protein